MKDWVWEGSVDEFIAAWLEHDHVVDARLISAIQRLQESGVVCCLTTSQKRYRAGYIRTQMGLQDALDYLFFSCEVGWQKPDRAYYQFVEKTLGLEKESILLLDDAQKNVIAAREFGWKAEVYTRFGELEPTLRK